MGLKCGIVGLPNVGKSTFFNALTSTSSAQAANFPFCTIEPNIGQVPVNDPRLLAISGLAASQKTIPTTIEFVDIAGLVKGASKGEGLGNQFLSHIREVDAIVHLLRCFDEDNVTHVEGGVDPLRDMDIIETELMLADLESLERRIPQLEKKARQKDQESALFLPLFIKAKKALEEGEMIATLPWTEEEVALLKKAQFLTTKPVLYLCNVGEKELAGNDWTAKVQDHLVQKGETRPILTVSASIEEEISQLSSDEQSLFLAELGLEESGLDRVVREAYKCLGLITFFTAGPKETRAWTVKKGSFAPQAAGVIHTDFEKGFICAETISYQDYLDQKGEQGAKTAGKWRQEGRNYVVQDGDVFHFRFNV